MSLHAGGEEGRGAKVFFVVLFWLVVSVLQKLLAHFFVYYSPVCFFFSMTRLPE